MDREQPTLETERLTLRPMHAADAGDVQRLAGDADVAATTLNIPHPYADGLAEAWIATHPVEWQKGTLCNFAVVRQSDGALVGCVGLVIDPATQTAELGYWVGKPYWSQGYATEAAAAVVRFGFDELGLRRIHARHMVHNPASGRVLQKIGMAREGRRPEDVPKWGKAVDMELYGMENSKASRPS